jgi:hypothetical protein
MDKFYAPLSAVRRPANVLTKRFIRLSIALADHIGQLFQDDKVL